MSKRVFYVVYLRDRRLQGSLDAMRLIADPKEKSRAHVTLRGPYPQRYNVSGLDRKVRGSEVVANGTGSFFQNGQNTVFIRCNSEKFRKVWKKADFEFNPHITIYDGPSREFARMLLERLDLLTIHFRFFVDGLSPLVSYKGQYTTELQQSFDEAFAADVIGERLGFSEIRTLSSMKRISLIESFARKLPGLAASAERSDTNVSGSVHHSTAQSEGTDKIAVT